MQAILPAPQHERMNTDSDLRAALQAATTGISTPSHYNDAANSSNSGSPHEHNIDPAIGGPGGMMSTGNGSGDEDADGRKGKTRELSQSKRAAQNRAAQRAFRQRKEGYIKKLEEQVREHHVLEENYKAIQAENYSLREYIIHLQSRLIDNQQEYPDPPPNINLSNPQARPEQQIDHMRHDGAAVAPMAPMSQLQQAASRSLAAAGLANKHQQDDRGYEPQKRLRESNEDSNNTDDLIRTQLGGAHGLPTLSN